MKTIDSPKYLIPFIAVTLAMSVSPCFAHETAPAPKPAAPATHHEAKEPEGELPKSYAEAVDEIDERAQAIGKLIEAGKLADLHHEAAVIKRIADHLSPLVAAEGSGVPAESRIEVLGAAKRLSAMFTTIDEAGDAGDAAASKKAHADLLVQVEILRKYAPAKETMMYMCPMHPDVTSTEPGKCPKCGMDLVKSKKK